jgi:hypothetical protein
MENYEQDATNGLSWDRMNYRRNINHPRTMKFDIV